MLEWARATRAWGTYEHQSDGLVYLENTQTLKRQMELGDWVCVHEEWHVVMLHFEATCRWQPGSWRDQTLAWALV